MAADGFPTVRALAGDAEHAGLGCRVTAVLRDQLDTMQQAIAELCRPRLRRNRAPSRRGGELCSSASWPKRRLEQAWGSPSCQRPGFCRIRTAAHEALWRGQSAWEGEAASKAMAITGEFLQLFDTLLLAAKRQKFPGDQSGPHA